ncbi:head decoration [Gordonia phage GMA6]|uniref:Trimeric autotransporter adhesin YadA-like stalk domain-containing protein n=1 Tax=Gordonia phage GMA6 TaxID=1647285 RepID=A0A0K0NLA4_9CAUD|nr:head decoration [Gordonia phage GMA6]AKL88384.1 hypothetical protein GMA6_103 [Gordonia phage GMA6]
MSAIRYGKRIDLQGNQILNAVVHSDAGLPTPTAALTGSLRYNTSDSRLYVCNGTTWELRATNADALQGFSPAQLRDRGTHTGTQDVATISGLDAKIDSRPVSNFAAATKDVSLGNFKITNLANGVSNNDAINVSQLDAVRQIAMSAAVGTAIKAPVLAVAITNQNLAAVGTIDGVTIPTSGRFLLAGQTDSTQNGIYYKNGGGAAIRATDADETGELLPGTQVFVTQGTANGDSSWAIVSDAPITIGASAQQWAKVPGSSGTSYTWGNGLQNSAGTISVKAGVGINVSDGNVNIDTALVVRKSAQAVPGGTSPVTITHGLNTSDIIQVQLREVATGDLVFVGVTVTGANTISLDFDAATVPAGTYRVAVAG